MWPPSVHRRSSFDESTFRLVVELLTCVLAHWVFCHSHIIHRASVIIALCARIQVCTSQWIDRELWDMRISVQLGFVLVASTPKHSLDTFDASSQLSPTCSVFLDSFLVSKSRVQ